MLVNLHVKNLAIIDEVEVDFSENMNVLTGETGAGKSIIIGSVNLALGGKFTGDMIRTGADQALVELLFTVDRPEQREALEALGVTVDGEDVLISRKLMQKRSVCRVNGETVTQSLIKKIAGILIGVSLVMIFLQEPLGKLAAKKKDWMPKEKGGFFVEAFFETFEILLSFVTNTVSFLRVGAFALNHAGMMSVVVMFMYSLGTGGSIAVTLFGNLLVIGLEGLIVGIQVLRLGFYEMFSRFYSGDGREFKPINSDKN